MPKENKTDKIELKQNIDITFKAIEYFNTLGIEILEYTDGSSILKLPFDKKLTQPFGIMHGGALFSLADGACGLAILSTMKEIKPFYYTLNFSFNSIKRSLYVFNNTCILFLFTSKYSHNTPIFILATFIYKCFALFSP